MRVGTGYDIHRLAAGRPLLLGGVRIDYPLGPLGHSDGDVLCHAVVDAVLGAAGLGDIGRHFPPGDPRWSGASGTLLVQHAVRLVHDAGFRVHNVDATVLLERPRIGPVIQQIREALAAAIGVPATSVNVKAKTGEGLDAIGRGRAIAAQAAALLEEVAPSV